MASHLIYSNDADTVQSYRSPSTFGEVGYLYPIGSEITLLEENVGIRCEFGLITSSFGQYYVETKNLRKLTETKISAPYVCKVGIQTEAYVEPTWYLEPDGKPFFNQKTLEYQVPVTTTFLNLDNQTPLELEIKSKGIEKLFKYYNKYIDEAQLVRYLIRYYIFGEVKDIYVPYRPNSRIKGLLAVKQKYFDAIPVNNLTQTSAPFNLDISNANFIVRLPLQELETLFNSLSNILKLYNTDVYFSNSTLGFRFNGENKGFFNTSDELMEQLSLSDKAEHVEKFYNLLVELLSANNFEITENKNELNKAFIEIAINDECNKIYDVAVNKNNVCTKLRVGIENFLTTSPIDDPTTVAFVKNIDAITKLEKCKVPWPEFVETYMYPTVMVRNISVNDVIQNFEKDKYQYAKDLLQIFDSIVAEGQFAPGRTYEQTVQDELEIAKFKSEYVWNQFKGNIFARDLFKADNFFSRTAIDKFFNNLDAAIASAPQTFEANTKVYAALDTTSNTYKIVKENSSGAYEFDSTNSQSYQLSDLNLAFPDDPKKNVLYTDPTTVELFATIYELKKYPQGLRKEEFFLNKIYDKLNAVGLCRIIDFTLGCLANIAREFVELDYNATITYGSMNSLTSKELTSDVLKNLPKDQQQLVYSKLLMETSCINSVALLYILKRALPPAQYTALGLDDAAYENIVNEVSKLMSTSPQ